MFVQVTCRSWLSVYLHNSDLFECGVCQNADSTDTFYANSWRLLVAHRKKYHRNIDFDDKFQASCGCTKLFATRFLATMHSNTCYVKELKRKDIISEIRYATTWVQPSSASAFPAVMDRAPTAECSKVPDDSDLNPCKRSSMENTLFDASHKKMKSTHMGLNLTNFEYHSNVSANIAAANVDNTALNPDNIGFQQYYPVGTKKIDKNNDNIAAGSTNSAMGYIYRDSRKTAEPNFTNSGLQNEASDYETVSTVDAQNEQGQVEELMFFDGLATRQKNSAIFWTSHYF